MDSWEWNKIAGAVLGTALFVMVVNEVTGAVFHAPEPEKQAYIVEGVASSHEEGTEAAGSGEPSLPDFGTVLAEADAAAGEKVAQRCLQCHTWDKGGANKIGPNLFGVVGAKKAHLDGFNFSAAMAKAGGTWSYADLYRYLESPPRFMPGNKMAFAGLRRSSDRLNLLAFMRTWADAPAPLPAPQAVDEAAPEAAQPGDPGEQAPAEPH